MVCDNKLFSETVLVVEISRASGRGRGGWRSFVVGRASLLELWQPPSETVAMIVRGALERSVSIGLTNYFLNECRGIIVPEFEDYLSSGRAL